MKPMGKREDILSATLDLIVEQGLHAFSFSKLFARAGVGSGTVYHYFASKEELVQTLYREVSALLDQAMLADHDPDAPLKVQFSALMRSMAVFAVTHRKELALLSACDHAAYIAPEWRNQNSPALELALQLVQAGQAQGVFVPMEPMLAVSLVSMGLIAVVEGLEAGKYVSDQETALAQVIEACWRALALPGAEGKAND